MRAIERDSLSFGGYVSVWGYLVCLRGLVMFVTVCVIEAACI